MKHQNLINIIKAQHGAVEPKAKDKYFKGKRDAYEWVIALLESFDNEVLPQAFVSRQFFSERLGITDYKGNQLYEGDIIKHPEQDEYGVITYEPNGCQFRIQYDPKTFIPSCHVGLQMGEKGQAVKVGNIYKHPDLVDKCVDWLKNCG